MKIGIDRLTYFKPFVEKDFLWLEEMYEDLEDGIWSPEEYYSYRRYFKRKFSIYHTLEQFRLLPTKTLLTKSYTTFINVKCKNILKKHNIKTYGDILNSSLYDLVLLKGIGVGMIDKLKEDFKDLNLILA